MPRKRESDSDQENEGSGETDTLPPTIIDYLESLDLYVLQDKESWPFLGET